MSTYDALLGTVSQDGVALELGSGFNFISPLTATRNPLTRKIDIAGAGAAGGGSGHIIEDEGIARTQRATLNFTGDNVSVTDAGGKTVVAVTGPSTAYVDAGDAATLSAIPGAGGAPAIITRAAAAAGVAGSFSRSDHKHDVSTAAPGSVNVGGVAAADGVSTSVARADHTHSLTGVLPIANGGTGSATPPQAVDGGALTNANATKNISDGSLFTLPAGTLAASAKKLTLGVSGTPEDGDTVIVIVFAQAQDYQIADSTGAVLRTVAAGAKREVHCVYSATLADWSYASAVRLT